MERTGMICIGFLMDMLLGDPLWLWHPVMGMGKIIETSERVLRKLFRIRPEREVDKYKKYAAGACLVSITLLLSVGIPAFVLHGVSFFHPWLKFVIGCIMCWQMLAMKSLKAESMKVYDAIKEGDIPRARYAVSMIVGRDTQNLDEEGVVKAAVETIAENTSDGVIAPLCYMLLFGPLGGFFYKAVNTMDSMIGYKNDAYRYFGTAAAKLDDLLNFFPARLSAFAMMTAAFFLRLDVAGAFRIYCRDRRCHASPNSAQTESVCAGALGIRLAGDAFYFGELCHKPALGDAVRPVNMEDVRITNRLMYVTSFLVLIVGVVIRCRCSFRLP